MDWIQTYIKIEDIYKDPVEDVETRFDTSNYKLDRSLPKGINKTVIGLMEEELGGKIMIEIVGLRVKPSSYVRNDGSEANKAKDTKKKNSV